MGLEWESKIWAGIRWKRGEEHSGQRGQHVSQCWEETCYAWVLETQRAKKEMEVWQEIWEADKR